MSDRVGLVIGSKARQGELHLSGRPNIERREAMNSVTYRLALAHRKLDAEISREQKRRIPDSWRLLRLKKLRLAIKDRLHRLIHSRQQAKA